MLIAQLMGKRRETPAAGGAETPSVQYAIPNQRMSAHVVALPMIWETPLRTGNLRDPNGPQVTFAFESFIDELAAAAKADPVQFRLEMLEASAEDNVVPRARSLAVVRAAAEKYGWDARPSPKRARHGRRAHGPRHRVHVPQQHRRRDDRRGRSEPRDGRRLGEAARVRARLRLGHQPARA